METPFKNVKFVALIVALVFLSSLSIGVAVIIKNASIPNLGTVTAIGVGVYWDNTCTNPVTAINWGIIDPGTSESVTFFVRNEGTVPQTLLLSTDNWNPAKAENYITLSWDYSGQVLNPDQVIRVTLTLTISESIEDVTDFRFDVIISGSEGS